MQCKGSLGNFPRFPLHMLGDFEGKSELGKFKQLKEIPRSSTAFTLCLLFKRRLKSVFFVLETFY